MTENKEKSECIYTDLTETDERTKSRSVVYSAVCKVCGAKVFGRRSDLLKTATCRHPNTNSPSIPYIRIEDRSIMFLFQGMVKRCYRPYDSSFKWYGAKGIGICQEWLEDPHRFEMWVKRQLFMTYGSSKWATGLSIDRMDSAKDYSPENCQIISLSANSKKNGRAIHITCNGTTMNTSDWSRAMGHSRTYLNRIRKMKGEEEVMRQIEDFCASEDMVA